MQHFILLPSFVFIFDVCSVFAVEGGEVFFGWSCAWSVNAIPASVNVAMNATTLVLFGITVSLS